MKTRIITYLSLSSILVIFIAQAYVVYSNLQLTIDFSTREIDAVLNEALKKELDIRKDYLNDSTVLNINPNSTTESDIKDYSAKDFLVYETSENTVDNSDLSGLLCTFINELISEKIPLNIIMLDSLAKDILKRHNIQSQFVINITDNRSNKVIESSKKKFTYSGFLIRSKYLQLDTKDKNSLQLILINPLAHIIKKMGILLATSFVLSLLCFYGLWFMHKTLTKQKKLMEVKNDFFENTAHELKRPVAQLHLALEALSKPTAKENSSVSERYMTISKEATKDMSEKITMIMALSMAEEGIFKLNYSKFNLLEEVKKLKVQFSTIAEKEVNITIESKDIDYNIMADKDHLRQCIANLLDNAIKYSGDSVKIFIKIEKINDSLRLTVKDNGIGIETDKINKLFEKYTRLNSEQNSTAGFGIGLSYVKTVIEKHYGKIEVKSVTGIGSEFSLNIPV